VHILWRVGLLLLGLGTAFIGALFAFTALMQTDRAVIAIGAVVLAGAALVGGIAGAAGRSWGALAVGAAFATFVTVGWVMPIVAGPSVDCGRVDEATCEQFVAAQLASHDDPEIPEWYRRPFFLPVLSLRLFGAADCFGSEVIWLYGGVTAEPLC
jgi:hypothetical protein